MRYFAFILLATICLADRAVFLVPRPFDDNLPTNFFPNCVYTIISDDHASKLECSVAVIDDKDGKVITAMEKDARYCRLSKNSTNAVDAIKVKSYLNTVKVPLDSVIALSLTNSVDKIATDVYGLVGVTTEQMRQAYIKTEVTSK